MWRRILPATMLLLSMTAPAVGAPPASQPATASAADINALIRDGRFVDALSRIRAEERLHPADLDLKLKDAEVLRELAGIDPAYLGQERLVWEAILLQNPTYMPAMQKLMAAEAETVAFFPDPRSFSRLHAVAEKILKIDPGNLKAQANLHIATIAGWLSDIVTPDEMIEDACNALVRLQKLDSSNPDVPYYVALARVKHARELRARDQIAASDKAIESALAVFEPFPAEDAVMYLRFYQVLRGATDARAEKGRAADPYAARMRGALEKAKEIVDRDPLHPAFVDAYVMLAQFLIRRNEAAACEKLLRELRRIKPDDQTVRLVLADLLHADADKAKHAEAIALLKQPITDPGTSGVILYRDRFGLERETYRVLTTYLIESYNGADSAQRAEIKKKIDETFNTLSEKAGNTPVVVMLRGQIEFLKGGVEGAIDAIPYLEKARDMFQQAGRKRVWDLELLLATAYRQSHQTGLAKQQLFMVAEGVPSYTPVRVMLIQMLIEDHEAEAAQEQLDQLKRIAPNDPSIPSLQLAIDLDSSKVTKAERIEARFNGLPEKTVEEMSKKASVAFAAGTPAQGLRLLEKARALEPANLDVVRTLVQVYASEGKRELAEIVINEAIAAEPGKTALLIIRAQLDKDTAKVIELTKRAIGEISDPLTRELQFYEFYRVQNQEPEAMTHLDAAEKIKPNDATVLDARFIRAANAGKWEEARVIVDKLAAINPDQAHGLIYRYRLAMMQGKIDIALEFARQLVKDYPQFARTWISLGDALRQQKPPRYEEAIEKYRTALDKQSGNIDAFRGIIESCLALDKPEDAKRYFRDALKMNPDDPWLKEQRAKMEGP